MFEDSLDPPETTSRQNHRLLRRSISERFIHRRIRIVITEAEALIAGQ
jgi:hypothetical protein